MVIIVTKVYVPAAIVSSHNKQALQSFGPTPFSVVCLHSHLYMYDRLSFHAPTTDLDTINEPVTDTHVGTGLPMPEALDVETGNDGGDLSEGVGSLLHYATTIDDTDLETAAGTSQQEVDSDSQTFGQQTLSDITGSETWDSTLQSCVLKDVFHVFNMLHLSASHSLCKEFARALCDTIFVPDLEDQTQISVWASHSNPPVTFEKLQATQPAWLWKRCR